MKRRGAPQPSNVQSRPRGQVYVIEFRDVDSTGPWFRRVDGLEMSKSEAEEVAALLNAQSEDVDFRAVPFDRASESRRA